jgi:hypothetical protein
VAAGHDLLVSCVPGSLPRPTGVGKESWRIAPARIAAATAGVRGYAGPDVTSEGPAHLGQLTHTSRVRPSITLKVNAFRAPMQVEHTVPDFALSSATAGAYLLPPREPQVANLDRVRFVRFASDRGYSALYR